MQKGRGSRVHFSSPAHELHSCSTTCRRNISNSGDLSAHLHNTWYSLPNYQWWASTTSLVAEHVSGAVRQNFPLIAQLHLRESLSPLRSRSDDFPLPLRSRSTWFFELRLPLRSVHLTVWPAQLPLPLRSTVWPDLREGEVRAPHIPTMATSRGLPTTPADLLSLLAARCVRDS